MLIAVFGVALLIAVLFTDGMHVSFPALRGAWRNPARGVVLANLLVRPASLLISLIGTRFDRRKKLAAAWFGPKGFASVVYGLLVLQSGIPQGEEAYTLIAVCIAFSIAALLPASALVELLVPGHVMDEPHADRLCQAPAGRPVADCPPGERRKPPIADADDTALEVAARMARERSPLIAVVEREPDRERGGSRLPGVITAAHLLERLLGVT